jgi:hypothetical protein
MPVEAFAALTHLETDAEAGDAPLRIVSYATTPLVGVPTTLARCINADTAHRARGVWAADRYNTGVSFVPDLNWNASPAVAEAELRAADAIVLHNGKVDERHRAIIDTKPVVTLAHNYMANVDDRYVRRGFPGLVVGQYQATLPEFRGWQAVPNPVALREDDHSPGEKGHIVTIAYTPSDRHQVYPSGHPLYWHGKGFDATMRILDRIAARHRVRLHVMRDGFRAHADVLRMKREAHIVIDECVTGSYHRNSLEGLAAGCVVVNAVGRWPGVLDVLRDCAADPQADPFVHADLDTLEDVLETLVALGPGLLASLGAAGRQWMEHHWDFATQWPRFWLPAIRTAMVAAARGIARAA